MFVVKHGGDGMVQCLEAVQPGMTTMIINQVCACACACVRVCVPVCVCARQPEH